MGVARHPFVLQSRFVSLNILRRAAQRPGESIFMFCAWLGFAGIIAWSLGNLASQRADQWMEVIRDHGLWFGALYLLGVFVLLAWQLPLLLHWLDDGPWAALPVSQSGHQTLTLLIALGGAALFGFSVWMGVLGVATLAGESLRVVSWCALALLLAATWLVAWLALGWARRHGLRNLRAASAPTYYQSTAPMRALFRREPIAHVSAWQHGKFRSTSAGLYGMWFVPLFVILVALADNAIVWLLAFIATLAWWWSAYSSALWVLPRLARFTHSLPVSSRMFGAATWCYPGIVTVSAMLAVAILMAFDGAPLHMVGFVLAIQFVCAAVGFVIMWRFRHNARRRHQAFLMIAMVFIMVPNAVPPLLPIIAAGTILWHASKAAIQE